VEEVADAEHLKIAENKVVSDGGLRCASALLLVMRFSILQYCLLFVVALNELNYMVSIIVPITFTF